MIQNNSSKNVINVHNLYKRSPQSKLPDENHPILNAQGGQFLNGKSQYCSMFILIMQFQ